MPHLPVPVLPSRTQEVMREPMVCVGDSLSYEKTAITSWLKSSNVSPVTGEPLESRDLLPNYSLRSLIRMAHRH